MATAPGETQGYPIQRSGLENSMDSPWGRKGSEPTEQLSLHSLQSLGESKEWAGRCWVVLQVLMASTGITGGILLVAELVLGGR